MRSLVLSLVCSAGLFAAVDGTVINGTTGKPQAGDAVMVFKMGAGGLQSVGIAKSDAQGKFSVNFTPDGPALVQVAHQGVSYNHLIQPGAPSTNLEIPVYDASAKMPAGVSVAQHMIFLEPAGGQLAVQEMFFFKNDGKLTYNDADGGTLHFFLPSGANQDVKISAQAPDGMPVQRTAEKAKGEGVYKVDFAIKPGETRFDVRYSMPLTDPGTYAGKFLYKGESRIAVPPGVTVKGDGLQSLGEEPSTRAALFSTSAANYKLELQGTGTLSAASQQDGGGEESGPSIQSILPRVYDRLVVILGAALVALALGFVLLYRNGLPADRHE